MLAVILSGSAAVLPLVGLGGARWFGLAVAALGALDLVFGFSHKARDHDALAKRFSELLRDIRMTAPQDRAVRQWECRRITIETDEPPIFWAVEADCFNEVCRAKGRNPKALNVLAGHCWLFMNWIRFERYYFGPRPANE
jgi:hypothetical protein